MNHRHKIDDHRVVPLIPALNAISHVTGLSLHSVMARKQSPSRSVDAGCIVFLLRAAVTLDPPSSPDLTRIAPIRSQATIVESENAFVNDSTPEERSALVHQVRELAQTPTSPHHATPHLTPNAVLNAISSITQLPIALFLPQHGRHQRIASIRHAAAYAIRHLTNASLQQTSDTLQFGDHTTTLHALHAIQKTRSAAFLNNLLDAVTKHAE